MKKQSRAKKKARAVMDMWFLQKERARLEDLEYGLGLTRQEAEAAHRYMVEAERRPEWVVAGETNKYWSVPAVTDELAKAISEASSSKKNPGLANRLKF